MDRKLVIVLFETILLVECLYIKIQALIGRMSKWGFRILTPIIGVLKPPSVIKCETQTHVDAEVRSNNFGMWSSWSRQWNKDWDHRHPRSHDVVFPKGKTIHLIMIRHGQYDLKDKERKGLTELGKAQAELTGQRLADLSRGTISDFYGKRRIKISHVYHSNLPRAAETAAIIAKHLDSSVNVTEDGMLAEGWPCIPEPYKDASSIRPAKLYEESARVEAVFRKYCHRSTDFKKEKKQTDSTEREAPPMGLADGGGKSEDTEVSEIEEEYIVFICHQNIIRYFVCRALQLPPEAWLRFRGSNCGITEIIISDDGRVSLEKFADVGHLPVTHHTFH